MVGRLIVVAENFNWFIGGDMAGIKCPICSTLSAKNSAMAEGDSWLYNCVQCNQYHITDTLAKSSGVLRAPDLMVSAWIRSQNWAWKTIPTLTTANIDVLRKQLPRYSVREKQNIFLRYLESKTEYPGGGVLVVPGEDFVACWAKSADECRYYLEALSDRELVNVKTTMGVDKIVSITHKGWEYLEAAESVGLKKDQVFVAMSFSASMNTVWENAFKMAIRAAGYAPYRIDKVPHNERIDVKIMAEIKKSQFLVADFTENKHGVYFEAGYALGLGIPVIWCVKGADINSVHFDTKQYNHIVWDTEEQLKEKLVEYIEVIIGRK